jgi:hypothetical protein
LFCLPGLIFGGSEGVVSRYHVLRVQTHFRAVPMTSGPVFMFSRASDPLFMFCAPRLIFGGTGDVVSCFYVLRSRTRFRRYRGRWVPFSRFALLDPFSAIPGASCPVFVFFSPVLVFRAFSGVGFRFHVLCSRTHFRRSRFHVLRARTHFRQS